MAIPTSTSLPPLAATAHTTNWISLSSSLSDSNDVPMALRSPLPSDASYCFSKPSRCTSPSARVLGADLEGSFSLSSMSTSTCEATQYGRA